MANGIRTTLSQAAQWCIGELLGDDREFHGVTSDSRAVEPGNLFIALRGPNHDGHDHIRAAFEAGAVAALVEHGVAATGAQIRVQDTRLALGRLAAGWRTHLGTQLVAITGSNGKTTVKEMTAAILATRGSVLATEGNLNNDIGAPLTLLRLTPEHHFAVIEMGANHPGEIAYLARIATPDVGVVTNVGPAHLEGFGSLQGVAEAKGELYLGLGEAAIAVINRDEPFAELWSGRLGKHPHVDFSLNATATLRADWQELNEGGSELKLHYGAQLLELRIHLPGRHNAANALAAAAVAYALGVPGEAVVAGLEGMHAVRGRLQPRRTPAGALVIDDSYNANPASTRAAIDVLAARPGPRLLALGDMGELGSDARALHAEIGAYARAAGIDALYTVGSLSRATSEAYGSGAQHLESIGALVEVLAQKLNNDNKATLLVKGSRSARMERLVDALCGEGSD